MPHKTPSDPQPQTNRSAKTSPNAATTAAATASKPTWRRSGLWLVLSLLVMTLAVHLLTRSGIASACSISPTVEVAEVPLPEVLTGGDGLVTFTGQVDRGAVLAGGDGRVHMELVIAAAEGEGTALPTDLFVVLDRSGSMSGDKIVHARAAAKALVEQLSPQDRFALVTYHSTARMDINLGNASRENKQSWNRRIDRISVDGGTNMSSGLDLALDALTRLRSPSRSSRLILLSDGQANEGDSTVEGLAMRAERGSRLDANLSAVGIGMGFNEELMTHLADAGGGNFYFIDNNYELASVFSQELASAREMVARGVEVEVRPTSGVQLVDAAGYAIQWSAGTATFRPGSLFAGQERRLWLTFQMPQSLLFSTGPGAGSVPLGHVALNLRAVDSSGLEEPRRIDLPALPQIAYVASQEEFVAALDHDLWARSVSEESYGVLQERVAKLVREGQKDEAQQEISAYQQANSTLNAAVQSAEVELRLEEIEALSLDVDDAFEGRNQGLKQNTLSKYNVSAGWDKRRAGAKKKLEPADAQQKEN